MKYRDCNYCKYLVRGNGFAFNTHTKVWFPVYSLECEKKHKALFASDDEKKLDLPKMIIQCSGFKPKEF